MKSQRRLIFVAALFAAGVLACAPTGARAGSLLSGYGGPGQGSQALLGAALIGGAGGGSSGGSSGGSGGPSGPASLEVSATSTHRSATGGGSVRRSRGHHVPAPTQKARGEGLVRPALARFHETGAGSSTLGLSGIDLVYIMAVLAGLVLVAALTRGAARGARPGAPD